MLKNARILVKGQVQGVGYRYFVMNKAIEYKINGFVTNLPDGSVEIEAEGADHAMETFIDLCAKGPSRAVVESIEVQYDEVKNYESFAIAY